VTPNFPHQNHGTVVWDSSSTHFGVCLRGYHPLWRTISGHFSLTNEEAAGPLTLHFPCLSAGDSVWTIPGSLAATKGIPCLVSFPPPTKMLPFGGFPLRKGASNSCEFNEKSHSGILGSKAACAYPRRYRGLPRPSSALKPSHPPDSVACFGPMVVSVWRLVKHIFHCIVCCVVICLAYAWYHHELLVTLGAHSPFTPQ
jgi:hypothetical protein